MLSSGTDAVHLTVFVALQYLLSALLSSEHPVDDDVRPVDGSIHRCMQSWSDVVRTGEAREHSGNRILAADRSVSRLLKMFWLIDLVQSCSIAGPSKQELYKRQIMSPSDLAHD